MTTYELVKNYLLQARSGDLKTATYPKEWKGYRMKVSFGMGAAARVPWVAFTAPEITVSNGYFPVYLFYRDLGVLVLSYGISETNEFVDNWPLEITNNAETIKGYLGGAVPRYGDSYVFKAYRVEYSDTEVSLIDADAGTAVGEAEVDADLDQILRQYQAVSATEISTPTSSLNQGIFYLEKQLEDFLIQNWANTELGEKYDLIVEDGELVSQQYRTDIGPIDILVRDKLTGSHVVIELKKGQTSDDTVGQVARYMGWVQDRLNDPEVKGIIIAHGYDRKLEYALKLINRVEVYVYELDFRLNEFKGN
jgi:hypothetical protein